MAIRGVHGENEESKSLEEAGKSWKKASRGQSLVARPTLPALMAWPVYTNGMLLRSIPHKGLSPKTKYWWRKMEVYVVCGFANVGDVEQVTNRP